MIRDMTNYKATHITRVLDKIKVVYKDLREEYLSTGHIETPAPSTNKAYLSLTVVLIALMILL